MHLALATRHICELMFSSLLCLGDQCAFPSAQLPSVWLEQAPLCPTRRITVPLTVHLALRGMMLGLYEAIAKPAFHHIPENSGQLTV